MRNLVRESHDFHHIERDTEKSRGDAPDMLSNGFMTRMINYAQSADFLVGIDS